MAKRVTIKDIAEALQTNSSTVSRALNDSPLISDQTKALVKQKAAELGYLPNSVARQLREGKSRIIGLIVPFINRFFFANVIHGVEAVAKEKGYQLLIGQSNDEGVSEAEMIYTLRAQKVAGIILSRVAQPNDDQVYQEILADGTPLVMFDRVSPSLKVSKVVNANHAASYEAVKHLLDQGYRKIIYLGGSQNLSMYRDRFAGYKQALEEADIPLDEQLIFLSITTREAGAETLRKVLEEGIEFDAVAGASDFSALGAMLTIQEAGYAIPQEKGIIGFANEPFTELIGMSSVEQYSVEMGKAAAKLLLEAIHDSSEEETDKPLQQVVIESHLIVRESSTRTRS